MTSLLKKIFLSRIALHVYFWIAVFASYSILYIYPVIKSPGLIKNLVYFPFDIAFTYFFLYVLTPLVTGKRKFLLFSLLLVLTVIAYTIITFGVDQLIIPHILGESRYTRYNLHTFFHSSWVIVMIALAAGYIKMVRSWHRANRDNIRLELEKTQAYNQMLRSKVNPHFLFNTLNNITSLIEMDKRKARDSIIELGDLMAYMVYEADQDFVPLEKELKYIKDFIALQSLRLEKDEFVTYNVKGNPSGLKIASMILIPFVENAFKYCDKSICPGILIEIRIEDGLLHFYTDNKMTPNANGNKSGSGFGIDNVKKRLEQLYPDKYELSIKSDNREFMVDLKILLHANATTKIRNVNR